MGAVDLVIQIEAPPSVASGMQRIGRAGHQVGAPSHGIIFPKYRADLIACAAVTRAMHEGHVESTRFLRNPLDVLAQQMVAVDRASAAAGGGGGAAYRSGRTEEEMSPGISYAALLALMRERGAVRRVEPRVFDGCAGHAGGALSVGRVCGAAAAGDLGPDAQLDHAAWQGVKRIAILNGGNDSGSRDVRGVPGGHACEADSGG